MEEKIKREIKKTILKLRNLLEKEDIPSVLKQYGIFPDGRTIPIEKLPLLDEKGKKRREQLEAIITREVQASRGDKEAGIKRYYREVTFTFINRLIALRCMEVRGLIEECIKLRDDYAGRSLRHHRYLKEKNTQFDQEDTDRIKSFIRAEFKELQNDINILFDPDDEYSIITPSYKSIKECIRALNEDIPQEAFKEPELIGWVYQYFQTEEKNRVFEEVKTKKKKIEGDDIVPATSLYTERYMVDYLVQNSLGAIWMEMYPDSILCNKWPYFVKDQDLTPREPRPIKSITFLDPACGSGHFLLVAFDIFIQMYEEEARLAKKGRIPIEWIIPKEKIATTILESNLHGIDIDLRSVQLSYLVLYLRMREHQHAIKSEKSLPNKINLVAADASLLNTSEFLEWCKDKFKDEPYSINILKGILEKLKNLSEIGSLASPEDDLKELINNEKKRLLAAWKKEKTPEQRLLFKEMLTPEQKELPFEKITDIQFWDRVLTHVTKALNEYYQNAADSGDTRAQVMTHEVKRGFKFLELCNKKYHVIATNPPYMGNKTMGLTLKLFLKRNYPISFYDLCTSFLERCISLVKKNGYIALVTQQVFMFLQQYKALRDYILERCPLINAAHLGTGAFSEIGGHKVNPALIIAKNIVSNNKSITSHFIRITHAKDKENLLKNAVKNKNKSINYDVNLEDFNLIPGKPFLYWLPKSIFILFKRAERLRAYLENANCSKTGDNEKYLRFIWEAEGRSLGPGKKWINYTKGGPYCRWIGNRYWIVDWSPKARKHYRNDSVARITEEKYWYKQGITFSTTAGLGFSARFISDAVYDMQGPTLFPKDGKIYQWLAILNSRYTQAIVSTLNPTLVFQINDILNIPLLLKDSSDLIVLEMMGHIASRAKKIIESTLPNEPQIFINTPTNQKKILNIYKIFKIRNDYISSILHTIEGVIDSIVLKMTNISIEEFLKKFHLKIPGLYPQIDDYNKIQNLDDFEMQKKVIDYLKIQNCVKISKEELNDIKSQLKKLYELGPQKKIEGQLNDDIEKHADSLSYNQMPIPVETFIEELSIKMKIHPISIFWLLREIQENDKVICWSECKSFVEDLFSTLILRLLGFIWPKQIELKESILEWMDKDGIIPISEYTGEKTLHERIRDRIGAEFGENNISNIESEFSDILYNASYKEAELKKQKPPKKKTSLAHWIEKDFFKRHVSQFKKRPIAWQFKSRNGAFQVLIFYHKISLDLLKNLKNRYLAKIKNYYEIQLERARKNELISIGLSQGKLDDILHELEEFEDKLDKLIVMPYDPIIDDGVRVNIAPLQKLGLLASPVLAPKDVDQAIADRNRWRKDDKEQSTV